MQHDLWHLEKIKTLEPSFLKVRRGLSGYYEDVMKHYVSGIKYKAHIHEC